MPAQQKKSKKPKWQKVTKEFVASHAEPSCKNCKGQGVVFEDDDTQKVNPLCLCSCATLGFRRKYLDTPNIRRVRQRIGKDDVSWLEFCDLVDVDEVEKSYKTASAENPAPVTEHEPIEETATTAGNDLRPSGLILPASVLAERDEDSTKG